MSSKFQRDSIALFLLLGTSAMIESVLLFKLDLYTFDKDEQMGRETYHEVCEVYAQILDKLTVNFVKGKCNKLSKEADEIAKVQAKHGKSA